MRITRPAALAVAAVLTVAPSMLTATAATAATNSSTPTATESTSPPAAAASASATSTATSSASSSATASSSSTASSTSSASATATTPPPSPTPPQDDRTVPPGARISVAPGSAPRLANVLVEGKCTQLAPIEYDPELDEYFGEQWRVDVRLSVDGDVINAPVQFASAYDGSFSYPVQLTGSEAAKVPAAGDVVVVEATCADPFSADKSFSISSEITVTDDPTCPLAQPESTGELDREVALKTFDDDGTGNYASGGWHPESDVLVCYYTNPDTDPTAPAQRFGADVADQDGTVSMRTIGPAVDPSDLADDVSLPTPPDDEDESLNRAAPAPRAADADEDSGDEATSSEDGDEGIEDPDYVPSYVVAVIGTGADGSPRVLTADVTMTATPASADPDSDDVGGLLAATGGDADLLARLGLGFVLTGAGLLLVVRRRALS